jgi:drug/metabolite transporter superfamily protein YnfA
MWKEADPGEGEQGKRLAEIDLDEFGHRYLILHGRRILRRTGFDHTICGTEWIASGRRSQGKDATMARLAMMSGVILAVIGILAGFNSPAGFDSGPIGVLVVGMVLFLSGAVTWAKPSLRKHAMHMAALAGLVGVGWGIWLFVRSSNSADPAWPGVCVAVISAFFLVLCVRSFIHARKARQRKSR